MEELQIEVVRCCFWYKPFKLQLSEEDVIKWEYFVHMKYFCTAKVFGVWTVFQSDVSIAEKVFVLIFFPSSLAMRCLLS